MQSKAKAVWEGALKDGNGRLTTTSNALQGVPYTFKDRFEGADGTNPEELLGAAHAGCFSMALSMILGEAGMSPERIETHATVTLEQEGEGFAIKSSNITLDGKVPGMSEDQFMELAQQAKASCPVSKALGAIDINLDATFAG